MRRYIGNLFPGVFPRAVTVDRGVPLAAAREVIGPGPGAGIKRGAPRAVGRELTKEAYL
jgi:hypothetical protein